MGLICQPKCLHGETSLNYGNQPVAKIDSRSLWCDEIDFVQNCTSVLIFTWEILSHSEKMSTIVKDVTLCYKGSQ